jgi:hypothetical protein
MILIKYYWGDEIKENARLGIWHVCGRTEIHTGFGGGNLRKEPL